MAKKEDRRSALVHPDFIVMISPNGPLRRVTVASNMASRLFMMNGSKRVLTEDAERFVAAANSHFGGVDVLVNNVGGSVWTPFAEIDHNGQDLRQGFQQGVINDVRQVAYRIKGVLGQRTDDFKQNIEKPRARVR